MKSVTPSITVFKDVQQAQLALGYRTFGIKDPRRYALTVMDAIMGRGMSSRLFLEVRERHALSYDIASRLQFFRDCGMWTVSAGMDESKRQKALAVIDREIERIRTVKVGAKELGRIKEFLTGNFKLSHEKLASKMFFFGSTMLAFGRLVTPEEQISGVKAVTAQDVLDVAREVLDRRNRAVSWVLPNGTQA